MRAICEACSRPQPVDWKPGDLCTQCGQPVRRELRCFWCVKWTPASGKFCRSCGAGVVDGRLFPAARMLKNAGVDRFVLPKMLAEMDPDQIDTFTNIYQRHNSALNRHLDHLRFLQSHLRHKGWVESVEEQLIQELPWTEARLKEMEPPLDPSEGPSWTRLNSQQSLALARFLHAGSPVPITRTLALLVRILHEDWKVLNEAMYLHGFSKPEMLGPEAALVLSNWRVVYGPGMESRDRYSLIDSLKASPFRFEAAVHMALLSAEGVELPPDALISEDPDIAFSAALVASDVDRLVAAEQSPDPMKRYAAAWKLIRISKFTGVGDVIRAADENRQRDLLRAILTWKNPAHELRGLFFELLESPDERIRSSAASALARCAQPGDAVRLVRKARGDSRIFQSALQAKTTTPEELDELCGYLLEIGKFRSDQWGMSDVAKPGRLPATFVPRHWPDAGEEARVELCKVAEMQLEEYADEPLHRFLVGVLFGTESFAVHVQAWQSLYRWYGRIDYSGGPLKFEEQSLERFFGGVEMFLPVLARFLGKGSPPPVLEEMWIREPLAKMLRYADENVLPHLEKAPRVTLDLVEALRGVMAHPKSDLMVRLACIDLLVLFARSPKLMPAAVMLLNSFRGADLAHGAKTGLERIAAYAR